MWLYCSLLDMHCHKSSTRLVSNGPFTQSIGVSVKSSMGFPMLNQTIHTVLALAATLMLQSEWVLYPFPSVAANANALCERTLN